jgi:hypothetical protein
MIDAFCKASLPPARPPGPAAARSRREVRTLAICGQWEGWGNERGWYRSAQRHLRSACPRLPTRESVNQQLRHQPPALELGVLPLVQLLAAPQCPYEALASAGVPTREAKRRGLGWLPGLAKVGWSNRLGWYEDVPVLLAVTPGSVITGDGFGPASTKAHLWADTFLALRPAPPPPGRGAGAPAYEPYGVAKGCVGVTDHPGWAQPYGVRVLCPPKRHSTRPWPNRLRRWVAGLRQRVETVYDKRSHTVHLARERPHDLTGLQACWTAKIALHNVCIWLNEQLGRPRLAFTDLVDW